MKKGFSFIFLKVRYQKKYCFSTGWLPYLMLAGKEFAYAAQTRYQKSHTFVKFIFSNTFLCEKAQDCSYWSQVECIDVLKELTMNPTVWYCHMWSNICCLLQHGGLWGEKGNMWNHLPEIRPVYFQLSLLGKFPFWHCWACTKDLITKVLVLV